MYSQAVHLKNIRKKHGYYIIILKCAWRDAEKLTALVIEGFFLKTAHFQKKKKKNNALEGNQYPIVAFSVA